MEDNKNGAGVFVISACLLGIPCKYNGESNACGWVKEFAATHDHVAVCPEVAGGLGVPRSPSERRPDGRILTKEGEDVTAAFACGAEKELARCLEEMAGRRDPCCPKKETIFAAILKANSPSCGRGKIYDGTFTKTPVAGDGIFAELLQKKGIPVFTEEERESFAAFVSDAE